MNNGLFVVSFTMIISTTLGNSRYKWSTRQQVRKKEKGAHIVEIAGTEIGTEARLAAALGVEGAAELNESAFSSDNVTVALERTTDGKAKATVTRRVKDNAPYQSGDAFFMRVKVK